MPISKPSVYFVSYALILNQHSTRPRLLLTWSCSYIYKRLPPNHSTCCHRFSASKGLTSSSDSRLSKSPCLVQRAGAVLAVPLAGPPRLIPRPDEVIAHTPPLAVSMALLLVAVQLQLAPRVDVDPTSRQLGLDGAPHIRLKAALQRPRLKPTTFALACLPMNRPSHRRQRVTLPGSVQKDTPTV